MTRAARVRKTRTPKHGVVILGSFRKHYPAIRELARKLEAAGIQVLWPRPARLKAGEEFPCFRTDQPQIASRELELRLLEEVLKDPRCDVVIVANFVHRGKPYIGLDTAFEIGWAAGEGKLIAALNPISESPVISALLNKVASPEGLIEMLQKRSSTREQAKALIRESFGKRPDLPTGKEYVRRLKPVWAGLMKSRQQPTGHPARG